MKNLATLVFIFIFLFNPFSSKAIDFDEKNTQSINNKAILSLKQDKTEITISLKLISIIGGKESNIVNQQLTLPTDVALNKKLQIIVVDAGAHKLKFYDTNGKFIKQIGKKGSYLGEFYYPFSIDINNISEIYVSDLANNRIQLFDQDGRYKGNLPFTTGNLRITDSNNISISKPHGFFQYAIQNLDIFSNISNIHFISLKGEKKHSFSKIENYNNPQKNIKGNELYFDIDGDNNTIVAYVYRNLIEKYDSSGNLLWSKKFSLNFDPTKPDAKGSKSSGFKEVLMNQCYAGISVDKSGRIWLVKLNRQLYSNERVSTDLNIMRGADGKKKVDIKVSDFNEPSSTNAFSIEIYEANGDFIKSIPLSHYVDNIRIYKNKLFIIDSYHSKKVFQYKILD